MDTGLVCEGAETSDGIVEWGVNLDSIRNKILNFLEHLEVILALDVLWSGNNHASHQTTKSGDTIALANTQY